ncbi:MAG: SusD/RagB family nutrient-binding outer membrane lipoprotein [Saprospiraceae bacterium]
MKNTLIIFHIIILSFLIPACNNLDEVNTNPNSPETVTPDLLLPQVMRDAMNALVLETWNIGSLVVQHTAKSQNVNADRYVWTERNVIWNAVYDNLRDVENIIRQSEENNWQNYRGVALVIRAWLFSLATDCYGDIPYTEALQAREGINFPKYDPQEIVYQGILNDLKTANEILGTSNEKVSGDVIYNGDVMKWRKLANSLRIRYLMRIADKVNVADELNHIASNADSTPIFQNNNDNAVFNYRSSPPDQYPIFQLKTGFFNEFRASKGLLELMVEYGDKRVELFFRPTPATENTARPQYAGIPNGLPDDAALSYNGGLEYQSKIGRYFYEDAITPRGLGIAKGVIMTYAELQFLLAEAAERGYFFADAAVYYKNGIKASFEFYGLDATAYLNGGLANYKGSQSDKLKSIGFQKWIALYFQGLEAWFDWRRTSVPDLLPAESNQNNNRIPLRFPYPRIEQSLNTKSYYEAVQRQGADDVNTKMWYLKD